MPVLEIDSLYFSSPSVSSKVEADPQKKAQTECLISSEDLPQEKAAKALQNPLGAFMKDLQRQVDYSLLKKAFDKSADKVEKFIQEHLDEMVSTLFATEKTQKRIFDNDQFSCVIKVRRFAGEVQVLARSECGEGAFKVIHNVVHLAGPLLENQPGPIYAYAKSKERKSLAQELKEIEAQIEEATCSECRSALESSADELRSRLERLQVSFSKEVSASKQMPKDADFVKMWSVSKRKDPSKIKGILMEYCPHDLYDLVADQTYPLSSYSFVELCQLGLRISRSVAMMHEMDKGLCHLDLKIGNILIKKENNKIVPKITDFGLVKKIGSSFSGPRGTLPYMAPEQFDASVNEVSPSMDAWGLGIILLEIFYGMKSNLFRNNSDVSYAGSHFHDSQKYDEFFEIWKTVGQKLTDQLTLYPGLDDIIKGLLTINPNSRWTARQATDIFENILNRPIQISNHAPILAAQG